jgi:hypothetical protein
MAQASVFSSQLLSQILAVGSLFTNRANEEESKQHDSEEEEDCELTPEELRREIFEQNLKRRIFYSDRFEQVERALIQQGLLSEAVFYCSDEQLQGFKEAVLRDGELVMKEVTGKLT